MKRTQLTGRLKAALVFSGVLLLLVYLALLLQNNYSGGDIDRSEINGSFQKSTNWIVDNKADVFQQHDPMLWWMLRQAASVSGDPRLRILVRDYLRSYGDTYGATWRYLLTEDPDFADSLAILSSSLPDYNKHLMYAISCDDELAQAEIIREQNETSFCLTHQPLQQACHTHQMMAFRFMQRFSCDVDFELEQSIARLASLIKLQLTLDFRLVDVYLQRVMMLVESGNPENVRPAWIRRILDHQHEDGGWDDFQPLIPLGDGSYFGYSDTLVSIENPGSEFHATVQGLYLMAMLLNATQAVVN